jgi:inosine-uridine nucleoside N-ribohydrolase
MDASGGLEMTEFRINQLSSNKNPFTELLDPIEIKAYKGHHDEWIPCDALATACFILPHIVKKKASFHATVELAGNYTKGQLVLDHRREEKDNVTIVQEIDIDLYKKFIFWVCGHEGSLFPGI